MRELRLSPGSHPAPFGADGEATMCAQEFAAYLAGEPHSDSPKCVSPVLNRLMVRWNDAMDDQTRQKLRPYIARTIGTAGDGQDEQRSYMANDWVVRTYTPALLEAAGLAEEAAKLRGLPAIEGIEQARAARQHARSARYHAEYAYEVACGVGGSHSAAAEAVAAAEAAVRAAGQAADSRWAGWVPAFAMPQASDIELLDRIIDPGGLHDIPTEGELFERSGTEPLASIGT